MSKLDLWNRAAEEMREDEDPRWHAVADWLRAEAIVHAEMEPFADLLNAAIEQTSGVKSYIRFGRKPDGEPAMHLDTNEGATAVARAYLEASGADVLSTEEVGLDAETPSTE